MATMETMIQEYLSNHAKEDSVFAEKMANKKKSLTNCIKYIYAEAKRYMQSSEHRKEYDCQGGCGGHIDNEIVFGWANHYYDETDLDIDLTDDERKAKAKANAPKPTATAKPKPKETTKTVTKPTAKPTAKPEKKLTDLSKKDLKNGNDCFDLFGGFFN